MFQVDFVSNIFSFLTVLALVFVLFLILVLVFYRERENKVLFFIKKYSLWLAFFIALFATSSSLYYSEIVGFSPCELCWYQRIFMYPLVFVLGVSLIKKSRDVFSFAIPLVVVGTLIAIYHNFIYYSTKESIFCTAASPCAQKYIISFFNISIPFMSFTSFLMIGALLYYNKLYKNR